ncbi:MAG: acetolactate synthase small subunit [Firmicutes bacterium]|nr:acetolactate synthase small subunit [Bacillota bacterium]
MEKRYIYSLIVQNRAGVLSRIAGLLTRRGFNIETCSAAETENPGVSLIVVVFRSDEKNAIQIKKQLEKQVDVFEVRELTSDSSVTREHVMVKVSANEDERINIISVAGIFRANIIDVSPKSMIIELTGNTGKIDAFIETIKPFGINQVARAGMIGIERLGNAPLMHK